MTGPQCDSSASGSHYPDRKGVCAWCERRVANPVPRPRPKPALSELESAYRYFYDPDTHTWGAE